MRQISSAGRRDINSFFSGSVISKRYRCANCLRDSVPLRFISARILRIVSVLVRRDAASWSSVFNFQWSRIALRIPAESLGVIFIV